MFKFIVLDMDYPHLYLSELYIRVINDSDSNRAALNQMKITLTLYEVTVQESKITSYPAKIGQANQTSDQFGYAFTQKPTQEGVGSFWMFTVLQTHTTQRNLRLFLKWKYFRVLVRKTVKPIDPTNLSDFAKISDILEFIKWNNNFGTKDSFIDEIQLIKLLFI